MEEYCDVQVYGCQLELGESKLLSATPDGLLAGNNPFLFLSIQTGIQGQVVAL